MDLKSKAIHHHLLQHAKTRRSVPGTGQLTYYIFEGVLVGIFGSDHIHIAAWSGGGGGAKKVHPNEDTNNPYLG